MGITTVKDKESATVVHSGEMKVLLSQKEVIAISKPQAGVACESKVQAWRDLRPPP